MTQVRITRVKVCGVTSAADATACAEAGADAIGMLVNVGISPRCISPEEAALIVATLPPFVAPVIVMMPSAAEEVVEAARLIRPAAVQLHGGEPPAMLRLIRLQLPWVRLIKAIHVGAGGEAERARAYEGVADALLLDTASPAMGGTGTAHDWGTARQIVRAVSTPVLLAGGLSPANVAEAIRTARPYAVDVSSGVEAGKRKKDISLVKDFIREAKGA